MRRVAVLSWLLLIASPVWAQDAPDAPERWVTVLQDYLRDPVANRNAVLALRVDRNTLPPIAIVALGDAALRAGRRRLAAQYFEEVLARDGEQPWAGWAEMELGWSAVLDGDFGAAQARFGSVAATAPQFELAARLALGVAAGADGRFQLARGYFDQVSGAGQADHQTWLAARLGAAYAIYWAGDYGGAAAAFDRVAAVDTHGRFADDAAYGAARAVWKAGDVEAARLRLEALVGSPVDEASHRAPAGMLDLDPRWLVRMAMRHHRRAPVRPPDQRAIDVLDGDGLRLARAALAALAVGDEPAGEPLPTISPPAVEDRGIERPAATAVAPPASRAPAPQSSPAPPSPARDGGAAGWIVAAVLAFVAYAVWRALRRNERAPRRTR
jgi:tetratricopeptide (TPR) repeat protein